MAKEDLISIGERTKDEQQNITKSGGIASGVARRKKILMRKMLPDLLEKGAFSENDLAMLAEYGEDPEEVNQAGLALMGLINAAKGGSVPAVKQIMEMTGEDERLKIEQKKLKLEQEKLKLLKERQSSGDDLDKLDEILEKLGT